MTATPERCGLIGKESERKSWALSAVYEGNIMKLMKLKNAGKYAAGAALLAASNAAMAATTGNEFKSLSDMLKAWAEGYLGLALALAAFVIGLAVGLMKQTIMPAIVGIGVGLAATLGPTIIGSFFTAII